MWQCPQPLQELVPEWWQKRDVHAEQSLTRVEQCQGRSPLGSSCFPDPDVLGKWVFSLFARWLLISLVLSCPLPLKSRVVFRNQRCGYDTPQLGVKQGRICLASGKGFVTAVSVSKRPARCSKDQLLCGWWSPISRQGMRQRSELRALVCRELFQRVLDVVESRWTPQQHGKDPVSREAQLNLEFRETRWKFC